MNIIFHAISEKGRRHQNEDAICALHLDLGTYFFAVADGMGGAKGGAEASNLVIREIEKYLWDHFSASSIKAEELKSLLSEVFKISQNTIRQFIKEQPDFNGMGTTLTALIIKDNCYAWGNLGDSRIYVSKPVGAMRLTRDHSFLEDTPAGTFENNFELPPQYVNALTRAIDGGTSEPEIFPESEAYQSFHEETTWLLCSDGLIVDKQLPFESTIDEYFKDKKDIQKTSTALIKRALDEGSTDNISLILVRARIKQVVPGKPTKKIILPSRKKESRKRKIRKIIFYSVIIISVSFILAGGIWFIKTTLREKQSLDDQFQIQHNTSEELQPDLLDGN